VLPVSPIGRYVETNSIMHGLDARTKSISLLCAVVACLSIHSVWSLAMVVALFLLAVAFAGIRVRVAIGSVKLAAFLVVLAAALNFLFWQSEGAGLIVGPRPRLEGLFHGLLVGARLVLMIGFVNVFLLSTAPGECSEAVAFFVSPFRRLARSTAAVPMVIMIALRFLPLVFAEGNRIMAAQRSRGMKSSRALAGRIGELKPLVVPLFRSVLRRADELSIALEVRCFDPYQLHRSAFAKGFGLKDVSALACSLSVLGLVRLVG